MNYEFTSTLKLIVLGALGWALYYGFVKFKAKTWLHQRTDTRIRRAEQEGNAWAWAVYNVDGMAPAEIEVYIDGRAMGDPAVGSAFNSGARQAIEEMKYYESLVKLNDPNGSHPVPAHA